MKKGLIIREPWISMILEGIKTWEIRGSKTNIRGKIYLIKSKTQMVFGEINLIDCIKINEKIYEENRDKHCISKEYILPYTFDRMYAWVLSEPIIYEKPFHYHHKQGCVIWVNF